jgi:hypothetical protein
MGKSFWGNVFWNKADIVGGVVGEVGQRQGGEGRKRLDWIYLIG